MKSILLINQIPKFLFFILDFWVPFPPFLVFVDLILIFKWNQSYG